jgi:hypothetical protein
MRRSQFRPRPVAAGQAPCVEGRRIIESHAPFCADCAADAPCVIVTLAAQTDARDFMWGAAGPPPSAPLGAAIAWDDLALAKGADKLAKYFEGGIVEPIEGLGAPEASSGGTALASFVVWKADLVLPAHAQQDMAALVTWTETLAAGALARIHAVRGHQARQPGGQVRWRTRAFETAVLPPADPAVLLSPRAVLDARPLNGFQAPWPVRLLSMAEIIAAMSPGCFVSVRDVAGGYTHARLSPEAARLCQTHVPRRGPDGRVRMVRVQHTREVFGDATAVAFFSALSGYLVWLCYQRGLPPGVWIGVYIDDFYVIGPTRESCLAGTAVLEAAASELGLTFGHEKDQTAQQRVVIQGLLIDTVAGTVSLPPAKAAKRLLQLMVAVRCAEARIPVPKRFLASLLGRLQHWAGSAFPTGRAFLRRAWRVLAWGDEGGAAAGQTAAWRSEHRHNMEADVPLHHEALAEALGELRWWLAMLRAGGLAPQRLLGSRGSPLTFIMPSAVSDAAGEVGWGLCLGLARLWGTWEGPDELGGSSSRKELVPVVALLQRYGPLFVGLVVVAATDNQANAYAINKMASAGDAGVLMRLLATLSMLAGATPLALWTPRETLPSLDALSRCVSLPAALDLCRRPVVHCRRVQDTPADGWGFRFLGGPGNGTLAEPPAALLDWGRREARRLAPE